jgi:hypothetical protein
MSELEINELHQKQKKAELQKIAGKAQHIEINERTIQAYNEEYTKKGLVPEGEKDYPHEDYHLVAQQKDFDARVDPSKGIRKIIESMIRQPITIFDKNGQPQIKDALYYSGYWYGYDKKDTEWGAPFHEGSYKRPKIAFTYTDAINHYDPKTGERRGSYKASGYKYEYYIFLSEDKKERRKQIEEIVNKAPGTHISTLETRGGLHYRHPSTDNNRLGMHGGSFSFNLFCDLSLQQLGDLQTKRYYTDDAGIIRDATGTKVSYDPSTKRVETGKDR